jgi:type I restriction enzyme S subunit
MAETKNTKAFYNSEIPSDWEVKSLCEVATFINGKAYKQEELLSEGKYKVLRVGNFFTKGEWYYSDLELEDDKYVNDGDLMYAWSASFGPQFWNGEKTIYHYHIWKVIASELTTKQFLFFLLDYDTQRILSSKQGGTMFHITKGDMEKRKSNIPPLSEQKAIAQVLSTADAAIHTTEKLIAQKELRKKWLMQQLLTGKKRLKGFENTKWKIQPLENFIKPIVREVPKPSTPYLGIGLRSHGKGTFLKHDEQPEKNSMDNFYVVRPNDLIVNITFAWEQAIAIVRPEDDGALASHRFPTYTFIEDKGHPDFFRFYILQPRMKFMLQMISPGGAGRNRVMSKSDFIKLEFLLPDYKEQTAIAQVLQAAGKEISLLKAKSEKLREQKKGLMQQLLTGKVRLKID